MFLKILTPDIFKIYSIIATFYFIAMNFSGISF